MEKTTEFQPHPVFYEESGQSQLESFIEFHSKNDTQVIVLADNNTVEYCLPLLEQKTPWELPVIEIPAGEKNKNLLSCNDVWHQLNELQATRNSILINLGGGVVCDLGGFAASVYKRGIRFIHFPTSLMAMADAAIGGKTGVDFQDLKNIIGTFTQPLAVFIDTEFLKTLPYRQKVNGFSEMLKHGLIAEESYFHQLAEAGPEEVSPEMIRLSIEIKSSIVIEDPFEKASRKVLNFGHTVGHALESFSLENDQDPLLHGEAVLLGIKAELLLSEKMRLMNSSNARGLLSVIEGYTPDYKILQDDVEHIASLMLHDKKNIGNFPAFTLLKHPGMPVINQHCPKEMIVETLLEIGE
jgi:3-dehydroquinate synthase